MEFCSQAWPGLASLPGAGGLMIAMEMSLCCLCRTKQQQMGIFREPGSDESLLQQTLQIKCALASLIYPGKHWEGEAAPSCREQSQGEKPPKPEGKVQIWDWSISPWRGALGALLAKLEPGSGSAPAGKGIWVSWNHLGWERAPGSPSPSCAQSLHCHSGSLPGLPWTRPGMGTPALPGQF